MSHPAIAICIPTKNRLQDMLRCLRSIEEQDVTPQQIIVVDQSATKYDLVPRTNLLHVYDPSIAGSAAARNVASQLAKADAVFFLDDDVELLPNCLRALSDALRNYPKAVGFQCAILGVTSRVSFSTIYAALFQRGFFNSAPVKGTQPRQLRRLAGGATALRTSLIERERFDECLIGYSYGEDWEYSYRAGKHGALILVPDARVIHHESLINRLKKEQLLIDRWENFLYFFDKLNAKQYWPNRFWRLWWMFGESISWLRLGMGFPVLGIKTKRAPRHSVTFRPRRPLSNNAGA